MDAGPGLTLLTGPSGSGKSTILRAVAGIIPQVQTGRVTGTIRVGGRQPSDISPQDRPRLVGWVPQDLTTGMPTAWEEVCFPLEQAGFEPYETRRRARAWIDAVGVEDPHRPVRELSGGQRARVVLAAALAPEPRVLLLDEPMAQLDPAGRRSLVDAITDQVPSETTVVAATHRTELWPAGGTVVSLGERQHDDASRMGGVNGEVLAHVDAARAEGRATPPLSIRVRRGHALALSGPNGSGKTTLLWLLAGLLEPREGHVRLMGRDPRATPARDRAVHVGLAFQDPAWHVTQDTVRAEASFTLRVLGRPVPAADAWLHRFGLDHVADRHPWDLSGGERQRLAVVTALAHEPTVALLDEPTRGMDARHRAAVVSAVRDRAAKALATVVVTHDERLISAMNDHVNLTEATA